MPRDLYDEPEVKPNQSISDSQKRRIVLRDTVNKFSQENASELYEKQAEENHLRWKNTKTVLPSHVRVIAGDWGDVAMTLSKATGTIYAVLNMANASIPGGLYLEGVAAQEENMYRRTNCHFYIDDEEMDEQKSEYKQEISDLINGVNGSVYLDIEHPRVCIKGREGINVAGYEDLSTSDYFLFYELKSAADNLSDVTHFNEESMRKKIAAQLDTLKAKNIRHVVLSAFGCGAFGNPAHEVARIYSEELQKRTGDFEDVAFAIHDAGYGPNNFEPFKKVLNGLPLCEEQLNKLNELLSTLKHNLGSKEWEQEESTFLFFKFKKASAEVLQIRQVLNSEMKELSKISELKRIAQNNLTGSTLSTEGREPIQILYRNILKIDLFNLNEGTIDLFRNNAQHSAHLRNNQ